MNYTDILEKYKDNKIVMRNKDDSRVILQCMKESDPMLFNAVVCDKLKSIDNFLQPYSKIAKQLDVSYNSAVNRINGSCRSFRNPRNRKCISLELPDSIMEKLIKEGYRVTSQIVYDVMFGMCVDDLTKEEYEEICESVVNITGIDKSRFAPYISQELFAEMSGNMNKAIRKTLNLPIAEDPTPKRAVNYVPLDICRKLRNTYGRLEEMHIGVLNGMYVKDLTRDDYYELADIMVEIFNLNERRVVPYFSTDICKGIFGDDWDNMVEWQRRHLVKEVAEEFLRQGAYIALSDFVRENKTNAVVYDNPYDARVWLQAARDNSPIIYAKLMMVVPELKNVKSYLIPYSDLENLTGFDNKRIEDCKDELLKIITSY